MYIRHVPLPLRIHGDIISQNGRTDTPKYINKTSAARIRPIAKPSPDAPPGTLQNPNGPV
jgi:hypothetical protein